MKKTKLILSLFFAIATQISWAQYCGSSGPTVCTGGTNLTLPGFSPTYDSLPCVERGVYYDQVIQVKVPPTVTSGGSTYQLNTLKIVTISNLPCGLCWQSSKANNTYAGNEQGCIRVSGTSYENVGQFKLSIIVDVNVKVGIINVNQNGQDASAAGLKYFARVIDPGTTCPAVDTLAVGLTATTVGAVFTPTIAAGGPLNFCQGGSLVLTASPSGASSYQWFKNGVKINNANGLSYTATDSAAYTVQVVKSCRAATSAATNVVVKSAPNAQITPAGPVQLCGGNSQTLQAAPKGATTYAWSFNGGATGTGLDSLVINTAGNYAVTVTGSNTCTAASNTVVASNGGGTVAVILSASSSTICTGDTITLDAGSGYTAYLWSTTDGTQTSKVTSAGTYKVSVTLTSGGCTSNGVDSITITNGPAVTPITALPATSSGCQGSLITIDAGGGYTTYDWSNGGTTQTINPTTDNTYTVSATQAGKCGKAVASTVLTVTPLPTINLVIDNGIGSACTGSTALLDAGAGYDSYAWASGEITQTIQAAPGSSYTVTVTKTVNTCTNSASATTLVTVGTLPPTPPIDDTVYVCPNDSVQIDGGFGYATYNWSNGASVQSIYAKTPGIYYLSVTKAGYCGTTVDTVLLAAGPVPNANFTKSGNQLVAAQQGGGVGYTWYLNGNPIPSSNTPSLTITQSGNYSLEVDNGTCRKKSTAQAITIGIDDIGSDIGLMVAPNPASNYISVMFNLTKSDIVNMSMFDMNGRRVLLQSHSLQNGDNSLSVDISSLASGIYILNIQTKEGFARVKVSKQ